MNILYLAFACNPYTGSEAQCGWSWVIGMRNFAQVSLVTRMENKKDIQRYLQENDIKNIKVYYCDIPTSLNIYYKTHKAYHMYYLIWQQIAYPFVKKLHKTEKFDIIHHITLGDFRYLGPYWKLGAKVVFGPVGGAQLTPEVFAPYIENEIKNENIRKWINSQVVKTHYYKKTLNNTSLVLAANKETQDFLRSCMKNPDRCELLTENGVQSDKLKGYSLKEVSGTTTLLWSGRMVTRKGLDFLLDAIQLVDTGKPFQLILVGDGPEKRKLEEKTRVLGLNDKVVFVGKVSYETMQEYYKKADIFVFPSLRETTGTVLFEAMSNGLPVISFNQNGAKLLIDDNCGILVRVDCDLQNVLKEFAYAIENLIEHSDQRIKMGKNAYKKIATQYVWENKCRLFFKHYEQIKEEQE